MRSNVPSLLRRPAVLVAVSAAAVTLLLLTRVISAAPKREDVIVAAGQSFPAETRVVLWKERDGYDAYRRGKHFDRSARRDGKLRYRPVRRNLPAALDRQVRKHGWTLAQLREVVHLFVLHFDVAGTSRRCFKILQDDRNLSVHFLLDTDGTLYQTLDLQEEAWHATHANGVSIGIEIAHPGTWTRPRHPDMMRWYGRDEDGWFMKLAHLPGETGIRTPDFVPRPDRNEVLDGIIHERRYYQLDFTPEQYRALALLCATLHEVFPRIRLEAPRDVDGAVRSTWLPKEELLQFEGIVGHYHVQKNKNDPGPAMQWDRLLEDARAIHRERQQQTRTQQR